MRRAAGVARSVVRDPALPASPVPRARSPPHLRGRVAVAPRLQRHRVLRHLNVLYETECEPTRIAEFLCPLDLFAFKI